MAITIQIITVYQNPVDMQYRTADFIIQENTGPIYWWHKLDLPPTGAVQPLLDAIATDLYAQAVAANILATPYDLARAQSRTWYIAHPNASALFNMQVPELDTTIHDLVFAVIPNATTQQKQSMYLLLMDLALVARIYAFGEGLLG